METLVPLLIKTVHMVPLRLSYFTVFVFNVGKEHTECLEFKQK